MICRVSSQFAAHGFHRYPSIATGIFGRTSAPRLPQAERPDHLFRGTFPISRNFLFTDPACRPSARAIRRASTFRRAIPFRRFNSASDQSWGRARFILFAVEVRALYADDSADRGGGAAARCCVVRSVRHNLVVADCRLLELLAM